MLHYYINFYSKQTIENAINTDLSKINAWTNYWLAKFNPNKNKVLFVLIIYPVMIRRYCFQMIFLNLLINIRTLELFLVSTANGLVILIKCALLFDKYQFYVNSNLS
jgi:hypothetical protein